MSIEQDNKAVICPYAFLKGYLRKEAGRGDMTEKLLKTLNFGDKGEYALSRDAAPYFKDDIKAGPKSSNQIQDLSNSRLSGVVNDLRHKTTVIRDPKAQLNPKGSFYDTESALKPNVNSWSGLMKKIHETVLKGLGESKNTTELNPQGIRIPKAPIQ